jgi:hypothetical protein
MKKFHLLKAKENPYKMDTISFYENYYAGITPINSFRKLNINKTKHNKYLIDSLYSEKYTFKKDHICNDYIDAFTYALMSEQKRIIGIDPI